MIIISPTKSNADMNIGVSKNCHLSSNNSDTKQKTMAQQTAVGWLVEQYANENYGIEVYEQAKQMEKEQIINAASLVLWNNSCNSTEAAEQYYNETYGQ